MRSVLAFLAILPLLAAEATAGQSSSSAAKASPSASKSKSSQSELPAVELPTEPGLYAILYTSMGNIVCRLFEREAPKTVANFRGLATGTKAWTDPVSRRLKHTPLYSGTTFHRVIRGFMIQGGDPAGNGTGSPGYKFDDEIDPKFKFDRPGLLAMANSGPNTNGSQFFITVAAAEHLNGNYSIFGEVVSGQDVANAISEVPTNSDDKPLNPVKITRIVIRRAGDSSQQPTAPK